MPFSPPSSRFCWSLLCRPLRQPSLRWPSQADRDCGHRSVPRRLSESRPRQVQGARLPAVYGRRRLVHRLLLRLRQHQDRTPATPPWERAPIPTGTASRPTSGGMPHAPNEHKVSSVEDERYQLVDLPAASIPANQPGAPDDATEICDRFPRRVICAPPHWATSCGWLPRPRPRLWHLAQGPRGNSACGQAANGLSGSTTPAASSPLRPTTWNTCQSGREPSTPAAAPPKLLAKPWLKAPPKFFRPGGKNAGRQPLRAGLCQGADRRRKAGPERRHRSAGGFPFAQRHSGPSIRPRLGLGGADDPEPRTAIWMASIPGSTRRLA